MHYHTKPLNKDLFCTSVHEGNQTNSKTSEKAYYARRRAWSPLGQMFLRSIVSANSTGARTDKLKPFEQVQEGAKDPKRLIYLWSREIALEEYLHLKTQN